MADERERRRMMTSPGGLPRVEVRDQRVDQTERESRPVEPVDVDEVRHLTGLLRRVLAVTEQAPQRNQVVLEGQTSIEKEIILLRGEVTRLSEKLADVEEEQDKSGEHQLTTLKQERDELKEARRHWLRYFVTVIVGLIVGGILVAVGRHLK